MSAAEWTVIGEGASAEPNGMVVRCPLPPAQDAGSSTEMEVKIRIRHKAVEEEVKTEKVKGKASVLASAKKVVEKAAPSRPAPNPPRAAAGYLDLLRGVLGPLCPAVTTAEVYYLVLKNDHQPSLRGLWSGDKSATWAKVLRIYGLRPMVQRAGLASEEAAAGSTTAEILRVGRWGSQQYFRCT